MQNTIILKNKYKYSPRDIIGRGSFGDVYKAINMETNKIVALKMIVHDDYKSSMKEAEFTEQLDFPYLVKGIEHFFIDEGSSDQGNLKRILVIVMNYYSLEDIQKFINKYYNGDPSRLEDDLVKKWIIQSLLAVQYLHEQQTIHRDIKFCNFLLDNKANIHLGDLGGITKKQIASTFFGTVETIAPEIINNAPYTNKVDIFSLGCVWFELLTGVKPFVGKEAPSFAQITMRIVNGQYCKDVKPRDERLFKITLRMLETDPDKRPSANDIVKEIPDVIDQLNILQEVLLSDDIRQTVTQSLKIDHKKNQEGGEELEVIKKEFIQIFQQTQEGSGDCTYDPLAFLQQEYCNVSSKYPSIYIQQARTAAIQQLYFN